MLSCVWMQVQCWSNKGLWLSSRVDGHNDAQSAKQAVQMW